MNAPAETAVIKQHLIDPEICIRCNTCESICPVGAITHDSRNYVVDADQVQLVQRLHFALPHRVHRQLPQGRARQGLFHRRAVGLGRVAGRNPQRRTGRHGGRRRRSRGGGGRSQSASDRRRLQATGEEVFNSAAFGATLPPWSAAHAYTNLYGPKAAQKTITATVTGNVRVTEVGHEYDTHHIVLDFGTMPFPVLEGQSIGVVPPGH